MPNYDRDYKTQMDALISMSQAQESAQEAKARSGTQAQIMRQLGGFADIASKPVATQAEIMAKQAPQAPGLGRGWEQAARGIEQQGAGQYQDVLDRFKMRDRTTSLLGKYQNVKDDQRRKELEETILEGKAKEVGLPFEETREGKKYALISGYKTKDKEEKKVAKLKKEDEKKFQDFYKTAKGEGRGLTKVIGNKYAALSKIERALVQLKEVKEGKRVPDKQLMSDLSAGLTSMTTGGIPPLQLIGDTMYKSLQGAMAEMAQWASGVPIKFNTDAVIHQIDLAFKTFENQVKHELSKHASTVFNRNRDLLKRNPEYLENALHDFGHMIGEIDDNSFLTRPRKYDDPYTSIDREYSSDIESIKNRKYLKSLQSPEGTAPGVSEMDEEALDKEIEKYQKMIQYKKLIKGSAR